MKTLAFFFAGITDLMCFIWLVDRLNGHSSKLQLSTNGIIWNIYRETNIEKVWREL